MSYDPEMNPLYWYKKIVRVRQRAHELDKQLEFLRKENVATKNTSEAHQNGYQQLIAAQGMVHQILEEADE